MIQLIPRHEGMKTDTESTTNLGVALLVTFIILYLYPYSISYSRGKIGSSIATKGKKNMTISSAIYYSNPIFFIIGMSMFGSLFIYTLYTKKFFINCPLRITGDIFFFIGVLSFITAIFLGPMHKYHNIVIVGTLLGTSVLGIIIYEEYIKYFKEGPYLQTILITSCISLGLILPVIIGSYIIKKQYLKTAIIAIYELIGVICFSIIFFIWASFPNLPKTCEYIPSAPTSSSHHV